MKALGLIGYPLTHSFSERYFTHKFKELGIQQEWSYSLHELTDIQAFTQLWIAYPDLIGLNVTIPYKESVINLLDDLDDTARKIQAVNTVKREGTQLIGFNTDYLAFKQSLQNWLPQDRGYNALVLGTGGASKAVLQALNDMKIKSTLVSRGHEGHITYEDLLKDRSRFLAHNLIINATPVGTYPNVGERPVLPYENFLPHQFVYDLIYNPSETALMRVAKEAGGSVKNGKEMLERQAELAWEIWIS